MGLNSAMKGKVISLFTVANLLQCIASLLERQFNSTEIAERLNESFKCLSNMLHVYFAVQFPRYCEGKGNCGNMCEGFHPEIGFCKDVQKQCTLNSAETDIELPGLVQPVLALIIYICQWCQVPVYNEASQCPAEVRNQTINGSFVHLF